MNSADTTPGIQSDLIDLSGISLDRLRDLDNTVLNRAMGHVLTRTGHLRGARMTRESGQSGQGERID
jgi:FXSXX-COOH protein